MTAIGLARGWQFDVVCCEVGVRRSQLRNGIVTHPLPHRSHWLERCRTIAYRIGEHLRLRHTRDSQRPITERGRKDFSATVESAVLTKDIPTLFSLNGIKRAFNSFFYYTPHLQWMLDARVLGCKLAKTQQYDMIVCSSPPHITSLAAAYIAKDAGIPLVLDFRDPWSAMNVVQPDYASPVFLWLSKLLEATAVKHANLLVMNTSKALEATRRTYPEKRMIVVRNGANDLKIPPQVNPRRRFEMLYAGAIYLDRDPRPFLRAVGRFIHEIEPSIDSFHVRFVGDVLRYGHIALDDFVREIAISDYVTIQEPIGREELSSLLCGASVLVNLPQSAELCIPSKIYEYFEYSSWILALEKPGSATAELLSETTAIVCPPDNIDKIYDAICSFYERFLTGEQPSRMMDSVDVGIGAQASILFDALERLDSLAP